MSILKFFRPANLLPTAKDTGLSEHLTQEANKAVESAMQKENEAPPPKKKRKYTTTFSPKDRAVIGKHAAECGNAAATRKYSVGEITVRLFKKKSTSLPYAFKRKTETTNQSQRYCPVAHCFV